MGMTYSMWVFCFVVVVHYLFLILTYRAFDFDTFLLLIFFLTIRFLKQFGISLPMSELRPLFKYCDFDSFLSGFS
jgi:hypothetical protein